VHAVASGHGRAGSYIFPVVELGTNSYANKTYGTAEPYQPLPELMV
jgi:hypothetical protein